MTLAALTYPADLPCPLQQGYGFLIYSGVWRDGENAAAPRQSRLYKHMPTEFRLTFNIDYSQWFDWAMWINGNGYSYFNIELAHPFDSNVVSLVPVRIISDVIEHEYTDWGYMIAAIDVELSPIVFAETGWA
jgi:hypothetical protein